MPQAYGCCAGSKIGADVVVGSFAALRGCKASEDGYMGDVIESSIDVQCQYRILVMVAEVVKDIILRLERASCFQRGARNPHVV